MEKDNFKIPHYLSLSYKTLINNNVIHYILFLFEIYLILMQIMEIFWNDFNISIINDDINTYSPLTMLLISINKLSYIIKFVIYFVIMIILNSFPLILAFYRFKVNIFTKIIINLSELFFCRILPLFLFNYLFIFKGMFLIINGILAICYIICLIFSFYYNTIEKNYSEFLKVLLSIKSKIYDLFCFFGFYLYYYID